MNNYCIKFSLLTLRPIAGFNVEEESRTNRTHNAIYGNVIALCLYLFAYVIYIRLLICTALCTCEY